MVKNVRLFSGMNSPSDVGRISPTSFRFHGPMKAMFYQVLKLVNPPPKEWLDKLTGNAAIDRDIYYEYLDYEKQEWRRDVLTKVIPMILCLEDDVNYKEVLEFFRYRQFQEYEKRKFKFIPEHVYPRCWYQDQRPYRTIPTKDEILFLNYEMKDKMRVEDGS